MKSERTAVLVVEDDPGIRNQLRWSLDDHVVHLAETREQAIDALRMEEPAVVLLDLGLPPDPGGVSEGLATLESIVELAPSTKVVVITGNDARKHAVAAIGLGAYDFYNKPIDAEALGQVVSRAIRLHELERENARLYEVRGDSPLDGVVAISSVMTKVCRDIEKIAPLDIATMLLGESGTGKEVLAQALHRLSPRADGRLVAINCAAIPENLLESELFGHERGSFTGADRQSKGKFEYADGGTLFLDEIGDLSLDLQAKLLRFLQERTIERVGGRKEIEIDTRVVCATHKDLQQQIEAGLFREDLYYRLGEVTVNIPPLRARLECISVLGKVFLSRFADEMNRPARRFSDSALNAMHGYRWPGNIRELENRVKRAVVMTDGAVIGPVDLGLEDAEPLSSTLNLKAVRERAERDAVTYAMARAENNVSRAAKLLGVSRPTIYDLLKRFNLGPSTKENE